MNKLFSREKTKFYCFTPLASLVTFLIELVLAIYVTAKFKMSKFGRFSIFMLFLLGMFQLAEYMICKSGYPLTWAKIGFVSITFLPVIGLGMVSIAAKKNVWSSIGYVLAIVFSLVIIFMPNIILSTSCPGKFVVFNTPDNFKHFYEIYYFGLIIIPLVVLFKERTINKPNKELFTWMLWGYASFLIPTIVIYIVEKVMRVGTISVMCGFAVLFAAILVFKILPEYQKINKNS